MLRIACQTLRARRTTLAGAFVAIFLAVTFASATGLLMPGALTAPGGGRYAAADAVVRADPSVELGHDLGAVDVVPGPRLDAAPVGRPRARRGAGRPPRRGGRRGGAGFRRRPLPRRRGRRGRRARPRPAPRRGRRPRLAG